MEYKDYTEKIQGYSNVINNLNASLNKAHEEWIRTETNLSSLREQSIALEEECTKYTNVPIEDVPKYLKAQINDLDNLINGLSKLHLDMNNITDKDLNALDDFIKKYNIPSSKSNLNPNDITGDTV